jgi:hypothetical protein
MLAEQGKFLAAPGARTSGCCGDTVQVSSLTNDQQRIRKPGCGLYQFALCCLTSRLLGISTGQEPVQ